ncbi:MAG TPA: hypothetical protein VE961_24440 [Pyrinomonadaceae bacterium]|nr:hypothetical protein [Pyrinomonadaceae bacterium]
MDQMLSINQIMESTGQKSEAPIIRDLIDEALAARKRKTSVTESAAPPQPSQELTDGLHAIQALLLRLIEQDETHVRVQSLNLELLQETLAEAHAGRRTVWDAVSVTALRERGISEGEIARLFEGDTEQARTVAYDLAEKIKDELLNSDLGPNVSEGGDGNRQGVLIYEEPPIDDHLDAQV